MKAFDKMVLESVNCLTSRVFGSAVSSLIMDFLSQSGSSNVVSGGFEDVVSHLEKIFGSKVSSVLFYAGVKQLNSALRQEYREVEEYFNFLDSIYKTKFDVMVPRITKDSVVLN